ncbi:NUDIX domain-containing protein [Paenibacillus rhizoplanae]
MPGATSAGGIEAGKQAWEATLREVREESRLVTVGTP